MKNVKERVLLNKNLKKRERTWKRTCNVIIVTDVKHFKYHIMSRSWADQDSSTTNQTFTFAKNNIGKNVKERVLFKNYKEHFERSLHLWCTILSKPSNGIRVIAGPVAYYAMISIIGHRNEIVTCESGTSKMYYIYLFIWFYSIQLKIEKVLHESGLTLRNFMGSTIFFSLSPFSILPLSSLSFKENTSGL